MRPFDLAIVHHRTPDLLREALVRVARHAPAARVTVLDTAPERAFEAALAAEHPGVRYRAVVNHSYAHAVNVALREGGHDRLAVMNADVWVGDGTLEALDAAVSGRDVAAAGPLCRTRDGRPQDQGVPYRWFMARARRAGAAGAVDAPWLSGSLLMIDRAAARAIGGMDTRLRFGNEDLEWCLRARREGWRCRLVGHEVVHLGGSATPDDPRFLWEGLRGGMAVARRHHSPLRRRLQAWAVRWWCEAQARWGPAERRPAHRAAARMFALRLFEESPFGVTLDEPNPGFDRALDGFTPPPPGAPPAQSEPGDARAVR